MKNFEEIIAKIARENGTTPENVLREMQLAIDHAEYSGRFYTPIPEIGNHRSDMKETAIPF